MVRIITISFLYHSLIAPWFAPRSVKLYAWSTTAAVVTWFSTDPSGADGYIINATSEGHGTVIQRVEASSSFTITVTLEGLREGTTYNITVRAFEQLLGSASDAIRVHTLPGTYTSIQLYMYIIYIHV